MLRRLGGECQRRKTLQDAFFSGNLTYPHVKVDEKMIVLVGYVNSQEVSLQKSNSLTYFKPESTFSKAHHFGIIHVEPPQLLSRSSMVTRIMSAVCRIFCLRFQGVPKNQRQKTRQIYAMVLVVSFFRVVVFCLAWGTVSNFGLQIMRCFCSEFAMNV